MLVTQSRLRQKERRYQHYTGALSNNSNNNNYNRQDNINIKSNTIDQHRNSIQQRISNLQSKISQVPIYMIIPQKYHQLTEQSKPVRVSSTTKQPQLTKQTLPYPSSSQSIITKQPSNNNLEQYSQYRSNHQSKGCTPVTTAYRNEKQKSQRKSSTKYNYLLAKDYDTGCNNSGDNSRLMSLKDIERGHYQTIDVNTIPKLDHYYQEKRQRTYSQIKSQQPHSPQSIKINKLNSLPSNNNIQQQFTHLSKTISSLRKHPQLKNGKSATTSTTINQHNINPVQQHKEFLEKINNVQLYQMMKSILIGQQRLQKQLQLIKNNNIKQTSTTNQIPQQKLQIEHIYNTNTINNFPLEQKRDTNLQITQTAYKKSSINSVSASPLLNKNNEKQRKSPIQQQKNISEKENYISKQGSYIKQRKCHSAVQSKSKSTKTGKITKNKEHFYQLYKQAKRQRKISPLKTRLTISQQIKSSVWDKIKSVIQRSQQQDFSSSKINHQNNRYINDHLVNTIQLQRKLKNDLVKKVYDMCENKCLYK